MSFISILKTIGSDALKVLKGVSTIAIPAAETAFPQFVPEISMVASWVSKFETAIDTAEQAIPAAQQGVAKAAAVTSSFQSDFAEFQSLASEMGFTMTYDNGALQAAINAQVAARNSLAALQATFKMTAAPAKPAAAAPVTVVTA